MSGNTDSTSSLKVKIRDDFASCLSSIQKACQRNMIAPYTKVCLLSAIVYHSKACFMCLVQMSLNAPIGLMY